MIGCKIRISETKPAVDVVYTGAGAGSSTAAFGAEGETPCVASVVSGAAPLLIGLLIRAWLCESTHKDRYTREWYASPWTGISVCVSQHEDMLKVLNRRFKILNKD